jgi:peptide-methionine (S)-S-oxide reductase
MENGVKTGESIATFASGCFWCTEAIFLQVEGVKRVQSGYMGGHVKNPTYKAVCNGETGHAECIQITYDTEEVSYEKLLEIFWMTHDPTTPNRQGADVGTQYRSAIFYHSAEQKELAIQYKNRLHEEMIYPKPIVTEIVPADIFYIAEDYHQNYFNQNQDAPYCAFVIQPKLDKFKKIFDERVRK